jgi:hypothetical protein
MKVILSIHRKPTPPEKKNPHKGYMGKNMTSSYWEYRQRGEV